MIRIVVDANIILSALLGGSARFVLFDPRFEFITTQFTITEVRRYLPYVARKSEVTAAELEETIALLPIRVYSKRHYAKSVPKARRMLKDIDSHDVDILALALAEETYIWSQDKDFEKVTPPIRLLKTKDFF